MLNKVVGGVSILYFAWIVYTSFVTSGLSGILSSDIAFGVMSLLFFVPYLIAGIFLLQEENKTITILMGALILFVPFYLTGFNVSLILQTITSPMNLIFGIILPILIIYCALKEY